jgi:predicted GNAT family acetyltransferase
MRVIRYEDPGSFREHVGEHLLTDEPRHNVMLGLLTTLVEQPEIYPEYRLWLVESGGQYAGAALRTLPLSVLVAAPARPDALTALAREIAVEGGEIPGVGGALPEVDEFAHAWCEVTGVQVQSRMDQALHVLDAVEEVPTPSGSSRRAGPEDLDLVLDWNRAFSEEAVPHEPWDEERASKNLNRRLTSEGGSGIWLWEDPEPVCLVGYVDATSNIGRVGPVYTPPHLRNRGYATALTTRVSTEILRSGKRFCMLYTDLANPTSNAIYARVGYRVVCDAAMILFGKPEGV